MADPAVFVESFARHWADPKIERLPELLTDDIVLIQPMAPTARGIDEAKKWFAGVLATIPGIRAEVDRWSASGDQVFVEFRLIGNVGGREVQVPVVDRFTLAGDGRARERVSYFDPLVLIRAALRSPRGWWQLLRSRL